MNMTTEQADTIIDLLKSMNEGQRVANMTMSELRETLEEKLEGIRLAVLPIYGTKEAAKLLHTSPTHVTMLREAGLLFGKKSGQGYVYSRPDIMQSVNTRTIDWEEANK